MKPAAPADENIYVPVRVDLVECKLRRTSAWFMLYCVFQCIFGVAWDTWWHTFIGRDQFWIPPHILIYTSVASGGLVALSVVLIDTVRYMQHAPGVDNTSTICFMWLFHAPLGFFVAGFGPLIALIAAPLDNYWHQLYGIDITLWSPFHIMGSTGAIIGILGVGYIFASEGARDRLVGQVQHRFLGLTHLEWGVMLVLSGLLSLTLVPLLQFPTVTIGHWSLLTYPLLLTSSGALCLYSAAGFTRIAATATFTVLLSTLQTLVIELLLPLILRTSAAQDGLALRHTNARLPIFDVNIALLPLLFLIPALVIDSMAYWQLIRKNEVDVMPYRYRLLGALIALFAVLFPPLLIQSTRGLENILLLSASVVIPSDPIWLAVLLTLPIAVAVGVVAATIGVGLGDIWYVNTF